MIFITGRNKRAIEDHFDKAYELETELALRNKTALLEQVQAATPPRHQLRLHPADRGARTRSRGALRRAGRRRRAVRRAARRRPDRRAGARDEADGRTLRRARTLGDRRDERRGGRDRELRHRRDRRRTGGRAHRRASRASSKSPKPGTSPSTLAVVGRYVLSPRIFHHLRTMPPGAGGEIQLTDGIARLLAGRARAGLRVRRPPLRLRQQARLPRSDGRLRPQASAKSARRSRVSSPRNR